MQNERRFFPGTVPHRIFKKPSGFFQGTAGVEQYNLAGNLKVHTEVAVFFKVIDHHVGKMMDIDNDVCNPESAQAREGNLEQGAAVNLDQRFGAIGGERVQAGPQAGGEDHRFSFH
jgi:hypothetical protein